MYTYNRTLEYQAHQQHDQRRNWQHNMKQDTA